jgi:hypothetical protein
MLQGFLPYFLVLRIASVEIVAVLARCAVVAGHNCSPYLKL